MCLSLSPSDSDKVATFDMKLMDIDAEHLSIPVSSEYHTFLLGLKRGVGREGGGGVSTSATR